MADIEKVKRNIRRMIDQGAPQDHIEQYLAGEGVSREQLLVGPQEAPRSLSAAAGATSPQGAPFTLGGAAKSVGAGLTSFASGMAGMKGNLDSIVGAGLDKLGLPPADPRAPRAPTSQDVLGAIERNVTGPTYQPKNTIEKYIRTGAEFLPNAAGGIAGLPRRLVTHSLLPAAGSEAAGQATEGTAFEPYARVAGAMGGAAVPSMARRVATPLPTSVERQQHVDVLTRAGVTPSAGQVSGRDRLKAAEQELGGFAFQAQQDQASEQFTRAVLRRAGINANRATTDVVDNAFTTIGQRFNLMEARASVRLDRTLQNDLIQTVVDYQNTAGNPARGVEQIVRRVADMARSNGGVLNGEQYKKLRSTLSRWRRQTGDPDTLGALGEVQEALDDALERSMSPGARQRWQELRREYRNLIVVSRAVRGSGGSGGLISPQQLRIADQAGGQWNQRAYVRGRSGYSDLAHSGEEIMKMPPRSGSPERAAVRGAFGPIVGGLTGSAIDPWGAIPGAAVGMALPWTAGRGLMSGPVQRWLSNQRFPAAPGEIQRRMAAQALLYGPRLLGAPGP